MHSFESFAAIVLDQCAPDFGISLPIDPDLKLVDELGVDSFGLYLVLVAMEDMDAEVPDDLFPMLETLRDLYEHYCVRHNVSPDYGTASEQPGA